MLGTIEAIQRGLTEDGFVLRYEPGHSDEGLPGGEGVFRSVPSGSSTLFRVPGAEPKPPDLSKGSWPCATTSDCSARNGIPVRPATGQHPAGLRPFALVTTAFQLHRGLADQSNKTIHRRTRREGDVGRPAGRPSRGSPRGLASKPKMAPWCVPGFTATDSLNARMSG